MLNEAIKTLEGELADMAAKQAEATQIRQDENAVTKATKEADVKGKQSEVKNLEVAIGNYKEDKATTGEELDAVLAYLDKLKPQCATKVVSYAEKKAAREQEIAGLKEALQILSAEASFLQTGLVRRA